MGEELTKVAVSTAEKVAEQSQKPSQGLPGDSNFSQVLTDQLGRTDGMRAQMFEMFGFGAEQGNRIQAIPADGISIDPARTGESFEIRTQNQLFDLMGDTNRRALQLDSIMELATSGRNFSPTELLAMQAGVYSCVQEIEIMSKMMEGLNTAQKQLVNTNVA